MQVYKMIKKRANPIFGKNIVRLRKAMGYRSGKAFAEALKMPYPTIRDIEGGISGGNQETRDEISKFLGVTEAELLTDPNMLDIEAKPPLEQAFMVTEAQLKTLSEQSATTGAKAMLDAIKAPPVSNQDSPDRNLMQTFVDGMSDKEIKKYLPTFKSLVFKGRNKNNKKQSKPG